MPLGYIKITSRPPGGVPEVIRDQWIGLTLPFQGAYNGKLADPVTLELVPERVTGYQVLWEDAMNALEEVSPETRRWWEENVFGFSTLIFGPSCCEVVRG